MGFIDDSAPGSKDLLLEIPCVVKAWIESWSHYLYLLFLTILAISRVLEIEPGIEEVGKIKCIIIAT